MGGTTMTVLFIFIVAVVHDDSFLPSSDIIGHHRTRARD
jgi:hypothetical protein